MTDPIKDIEATLNRTAEVDYLLLADRAEVINNKVYIMGGGWDEVTFKAYPRVLPLGLLVGFRIPWSEANRQHKVVIEISRDESPEPLLRIEAELETGRPPRRGPLDALVPLAFNGQVGLEKAGTYIVSARIGSASMKRQVMTAIQSPA